MCELFGLSSSAPVGMTYALHEFATHGGLVHRNKSGWGIAYRREARSSWRAASMESRAHGLAWSRSRLIGMPRTSQMP